VFNEIFDAVDSKNYYSKIFGVLPKENSTGNVLVKCPFHDDRESSLALQIRDRGGLVYCHGCGYRGNLVQFHQKYKGFESLEEAVRDLIELFSIDVTTMSSDYLDDSHIPEFNAALLANTKFLQHLENMRGIDKDTIRRFQLGLEIREVEGRKVPRITIPIYDSENKLVNIRRWLPEFERKTKEDEARKTIGMPGHNDNRLFPIAALQQQQIIICEGELDCMVLQSNNLNAITATAGCQNFNRSWYRQFRDKDVVIILDNDEAGHSAENKLMHNLYDYVRSVRIVHLSPTLNDKDVTDIWREFKTDFRTYLVDLINATPPYNKPSQLDTDAKEVNLYQAAREDLIGRKIRVRALVAGKEDRPFAIPKKIKLTCHAGKKDCPNCPKTISDGVLEKLVRTDSKYVLELLFTGRSSYAAIFRKIFDVHCKVSEAFEIIEEQNVEEIRLIPDLDMSDETVSYTIRQCYYIGYGLDYNEIGDFTGITTIDPRNNAVTHVFWKAERIHSARDSINVTEEIEIDGHIDTVFNHLKVFQPRHKQTIFAKLKEIYTDLEYNVTGIVKRQDIIQIIDLAYHSPLAFTLGTEFEKKGWLDVLVIGDTHCGKTRTMKALKAHYRAGEIYDGTHISVVGIIGGYIAITGSNRTRYVLGVWPLNDGRLVCLDELSGMSIESFKQLTSVRSEGIAESTKQGQRNRFPARVRFICLSNPRDNKAIQDYSYGVKAIKELIGEEADISRYDIAMIAAGNEVTHAEINAQHEIKIPHIFTSDLCSLMVRWAWSRKPSNIQFTKRALDLIMESAQEMGSLYDSSIPLVLGQSQRKKIARVAAAVAIRLFSTKDGEIVTVEEDHVEAALKIFNDFYTKPSMGYHTYSATEKRANSLPNIEGVKKLLDTCDYMIYEFLVSSRTGNIGKNDIIEYSGEHDVKVSKIFRELIRYRCISKKGRFYKCTPAFIQFLKSYSHPRKDNYFSEGNGIEETTEFTDV